MAENRRGSLFIWNETVSTRFVLSQSKHGERKLEKLKTKPRPVIQFSGQTVKFATILSLSYSACSASWWVLRAASSKCPQPIDLEDKSNRTSERKKYPLIRLVVLQIQWKKKGCSHWWLKSFCWCLLKAKTLHYSTLQPERLFQIYRICTTGSSVQRNPSFYYKFLDKKHQGIPERGI